MQPQIFLSYSWRNKDIADAIDKDWQGVGITMTRDVRDVGYKGNLKDFMKRVHESDFVLLLISKDYLESKNCMYEALEMFEDPNFKRKILPILTDDAKLSDPLARIKYLDYWEDKKQELDEGYRGMKSAAKAASIAAELDHYDKIRNTWDSFADQIQSILCATWPRTQEIGYSDIFNHIGYSNDESSILEECVRILTLPTEEDQELGLAELKELHPHDGSVLFTESTIAYRAEKYRKAQKIVEKLLTIVPDSYQAHNNLALLLFHHAKDFAGAQQHYERALELNPDYVTPYGPLAVIANKQQDYDRAKKLYERLLELSPDNNIAHYNLAGLLYENFNDNTGASYHFKRAIELGPEDFEARFGYGTFLDTQLNDTGEARKQYEYALALKPDHVPSLNNLGLLLKDDHIKEYDQARSYFERALEIEPNSRKLHFNLAMLLMERFEEWGLVRHHLEAVITIEPNDVSAIAILGKVLTAPPIEEYTTARQQYERALELNPDFSIVHYELAELLKAEFQEYSQARYHFEQAIKLDPDNPMVNHDLGVLIDEHFGESEEGERLLKRAIKLNPNFGTAHFNLALLLHERGDDIGAKEHYIQSYKIHPDYKTPESDELFGVL
jgi:tetratricopeptide (TPR) repeat protein